MTEQEKQETLDMIACRIAVAEHHGLTATANSWRELYATITARPAGTIICSEIFRASLAAHRERSR